MPLKPPAGEGVASRRAQWVVLSLVLVPLLVRGLVGGGGDAAITVVGMAVLIPLVVLALKASARRERLTMSRRADGYRRAYLDSTIPLPVEVYEQVFGKLRQLGFASVIAN